MLMMAEEGGEGRTREKEGKTAQRLPNHDHITSSHLGISGKRPSDRLTSASSSRVSANDDHEVQ
jgi:hypothetical protein